MSRPMGGPPETPSSQDVTLYETAAVADRLAEVLGADAVSTDSGELASTSHDTWPVSTKWALGCLLTGRRGSLRCGWFRGRRPRAGVTHGTGDWVARSSTAEGLKIMQYAVRYRLKLDEVARDEELLELVYAELAEQAPDWLRCQSLRLDNAFNSVLLVDVEDMARLGELPELSRYLETLTRRGEEQPRAGVIDASPDVTGARELGLWDPDRHAARTPR